MADPANPWTTLSTKRYYENDWIAVDEHQVRNAAGHTNPYGTVHFKHRGISILPIDPDGLVHLVGQYRYGAGRYSWEIPAGGGDPDEEPIEAARRELREEMGLAAESWLELLRVTVSGAITDQRAVCFVAWGLGRRERDPDEQEVLRRRRVSFAEAVRMALGGEITDAVSAATILALQARAHRGELPEDLARLLR